MNPRDREIAIAGMLSSPDPSERDGAVGAFVRLCTFSAPTELALAARRHADVCGSFEGDRPLVQYLLERLPIPADVALSWQIALLEGKDLSDVLGRFDRLYGEQIRRMLVGVSREPDEVYQRLLLRVMTRRRFRQTFFGKYAGKGRLMSFLRRVFIREAVRHSGRNVKFRNSTGLLDRLPQHSEGPPGWRLDRRELRVALTEVFRELADDPGLMPFLLQQVLEIGAVDAGKVFSLDENTIRQRIFRFRRRVAGVWHRQFPQEACPFVLDRSAGR